MKKKNKNMITLVALFTSLAVAIIGFMLTFLIKAKPGSNNPGGTPAVTSGASGNITSTPTQSADPKTAKASISSYAANSKHEVSFGAAGDKASIADIIHCPEGTVFTVSNPNVASVDKDGNIEAKGKGKAIVDATYTDEDGKVSSAKIDIEVGLSRVTPIIGSSLVKFEKKENYKMPFSLKDEEGDDMTTVAEIEWSSSNPEVATVSQDGTITPVTDGQSIISVSAKYRGQTFAFNIPTYVALKNPPENVDTGHNHVFVFVSSSATSCDSAGETIYRCSCGAEEKETYDKLGHDYQLAETVPATCTEEGHLTYSCSRCKDSYQETLAKQAHNYKYAVKPASCSETGEAYDKCTVCGDIKDKVTLPKTAHSKKLDVMNPDCTHIGYDKEYCKVCGEVLSYVEYPYHHVYVESTMEKPSCSEGGYIVYSCQYCDASKVENLPALGHDYESCQHHFATCSEYEYIKYKCTRCGNYDIVYGTTLADHDPEDLVCEEKHPTCTEKGYYKLTCNNCGELVDYYEYDPYGHNYLLDYEEESSFDFCYQKIYKCKYCEKRDYDCPEHDWMIISKYDYQTFCDLIGPMENYEDRLASDLHIFYCTTCHFWDTVGCEIEKDEQGNRKCIICHAILPPL